MAQQQSSNGTMAGIVTIFGLGLVWVTVATHFPSEEELFSAERPVETRQVAVPSSALSVPPTLDLTIPTSRPLPSEAAMVRSADERSPDSPIDVPLVTRLDPSALQATRLKCEAEIEQWCPDSPDGSGRARCLKQRAKQLPPPCQTQVYERFVKWKEDRGRLIAACRADIKLFCKTLKPGSGEILQCLQSHAQEVSDQCYQTLPKGTVFFK
ncbi:MAG TPA: cysteine rich repeat-containing protein [Nitrospiraceae bacterium]